MILTEEEAREKACCKERAYNDKEGRFQTPACLASGCMGWRWMPGKFMRPREIIRHPMTEEEITCRWGKDVPPPERPEGVPEDYIFELRAHGSFWVPPPRIALQYGYCGLAGRPE